MFLDKLPRLDDVEGDEADMKLHEPQLYDDNDMHDEMGQPYHIELEDEVAELQLFDKMRVLLFDEIDEHEQATVYLEVLLLMDDEVVDDVIGLGRHEHEQIDEAMEADEMGLLVTHE